MPTVFSHAVYEKEYFRHAPMKRNTGRKTVRNLVPLAELVRRIQDEESTVVPLDDEYQERRQAELQHSGTR